MAPLRDDVGKITHVIPSGTVIEERRQAELSLRAQKAEIESLLLSAPIGFAFFDREHRYVRLNRELAEINGFPLEEHLGRTIEEVLPVNAKVVVPILERVFSTGETIRNLEVEGETPSSPGVTRSWLTGFYPVASADGVIGAVGAWVVEITERKRAEEKIRLLMREVNHRSKNILSVVQAVARQTLLDGNPAESADRFSRRLGGLSASHDLLVRNAWVGVTLHDLVRSQLSHVEDMVGGRIHIEGPPLLIGPAAAQTIGMALHELVTNAAKYGSLSTGSGHVSIDWRLEGPEGSEFVFIWKERDGPKVSVPKGSGFGTLLLSRLTALGLDGRGVLSYEKTGVCWELRVAVEKLTCQDPQP